MTYVICAECNKALAEKTVATKTKKLGKHVIVEKTRKALVCECGIRAWDPPMQRAAQWLGIASTAAHPNTGGATYTVQ